VRALGMVAVVLVGCGSESKSPPADKAPDKPDADVLAPGPRSPKVKRPSKLGAFLEWNTRPPELDPRVTGFVTKDPNARELPRCQRTGWSYSGCWTVYPGQGRVWTKFECEHVVDDDMRNLVCHNYAAHLAVGDGGPPDRKRGLDILNIGCDTGVADCATIAAIVQWDDPEHAADYVKKACGGDPNKRPGTCQDLEVAPSARLRFAVAVTEVRGVDPRSRQRDRRGVRDPRHARRAVTRYRVTSMT
jgi:hypothetical protein